MLILLRRLLYGWLLLCSLAEAKQTLILAATPDLVSKISLEVLREAYAGLGYDVRPNQLAAERALAMSNAGMVDGEANRIAGIESGYPNLLRVPVAVNFIEGLVVTRGLSFKVEGWQSLKPYKIGLQSGVKFAENATRGMYVDSSLSVNQLFRNLKREKVDLLVTTRIDVLDYLAKYPDPEVMILEPPLVRLKLYHYLNHKHRELLPKITAQLQKMQAEGRIEAIRQRLLRHSFN
ncbi:substrate-binding periplasmic protein [Dongshaea marina]|uniref:substrate-binding periplasmic protein n=1 Tax=Dongshaea marina TaxID=2047966 RepID=UPI000D3E31C6|nr:transporter substrate-binding domain-containing protein [Dongshaea marina]